ncbi:hypothetical protein NL676_018410 [Syzygium grande]|nr:hypothetical protein NL676_018410 [Syzygium grande]
MPRRCSSGGEGPPRSRTIRRRETPTAKERKKKKKKKKARSGSDDVTVESLMRAERKEDRCGVNCLLRVLPSFYVLALASAASRESRCPTRAERGFFLARDRWAGLGLGPLAERL